MPEGVARTGSGRSFRFTTGSYPAWAWFSPAVIEAGSTARGCPLGGRRCARAGAGFGEQSRADADMERIDAQRSSARGGSSGGPAVALPYRFTTRMAWRIRICIRGPATVRAGPVDWLGWRTAASVSASGDRDEPFSDSPKRAMPQSGLEGSGYEHGGFARGFCATIWLQALAGREFCGYQALFWGMLSGRELDRGGQDPGPGQTGSFQPICSEH